MTWPVAILMAAQAVIFGAWAFWMFRTLFALRRDVVERSGKQGFYQPSVAETLTSFGWFFTEARYARHRRILGILTLALFATIAIRAFTIAGAE